MNKNLILTSLALLLMILTSCNSIAQAAFPTKPDTIQDAEIREAWTVLDQHTQPVQLWDGSTITGHELAQFVREHSIRIMWREEGTKNGSSYSTKYCNGDICTKFHEKLGDNPIYIDLSYRGNRAKMTELVDTLAHEIFHYSMPYGPVMNTLFEEYYAYYIGAAISGKNLKDFEDHNPLQPACLVEWFDNHYLYEGYRHLPAYPLSLLADVDTSSKTCTNNNPDQEFSDQQLECTLNEDGSLNCLFPPPPQPTPEFRVECTEYEGGLKGCRTIWSEDETGE